MPKNNECFGNMDNMGGIIHAAFVIPKEVKFFANIDDVCKIELIDKAQWKNLTLQPDSVKMTIKASRPDAGLLYEITGTINLLKSDPYIPILRIYPYILLQYANTDGLLRVAGTDEYPLLAALSPLTPSGASGFAGWQLSFQGKQLIEPPIHTE